MLPIPLTHEGKAYHDGVDFTYSEFYELLLSSGTIPSTSHIISGVYVDEYKKALSEGYSHVINVTINSGGSNMFDSATTAKHLFEEEDEQAKNIDIKIIDSKTYTLAYGIAVINAAKMAMQGVEADEITAYLTDWFDRVEIIFSVFSLEHVKKSGRISVAAAFVGELIGLRPIISMVYGNPLIIDKVRGDKNVIEGLIKNIRSRQDNIGDYPCVVIKGINNKEADELAERVINKFNLPAAAIYNAGAAISINTGPKVLAVVFAGKKR